MLVSRSLKVLLLGCAILAGGCDRQGSDGAQPQASASAEAPQTLPAGQLDRSRKGAALPDFTFRDPAGQSLRLPDLAGKPLLINLWATWCAPCVAELPTLNALASKGDLRVLTVSQDMTDPAKVAEFLKTRGGDRLEPWLDPQNDLSFHYATGTLPTTVLYDVQGREVWRFVGERDWQDAESAKLLAEAETP